MNSEELGKLLGRVIGSYQNFILTPLTNELWAEAIGHLDYEVAVKALRIYVAQGKDFPPNEGHIRKIAAQLLTPIEHRVTAGEVWEQCVAAAARSLTRDAVAEQFQGNPRALSAIRQVGWDRIRYADIQTELDFVRKDFIRLYDEMEDRDNEEQRAIALPDLAKNLVSMAKPKSIGGGK